MTMANKPMNFGEMLDGLFDFYTNTIAKRKNKKYDIKVLIPLLIVSL